MSRGTAKCKRYEYYLRAASISPYSLVGGQMLTAIAIYSVCDACAILDGDGDICMECGSGETPEKVDATHLAEAHYEPDSCWSEYKRKGIMMFLVERGWTSSL